MKASVKGLSRVTHCLLCFHGACLCSVQNAKYVSEANEVLAAESQVCPSSTTPNSFVYLFCL